MKKFLSLLFVLLLMLPAAALADTKLAVTGSATVQAEPDMVTLSLGVEETKSDVAAAQATVNEKLAAVVEALKNAGIDEKDIQTGYYSIYNNYNYDDPSNIQYVASCSLNVIVRDLSKAGETIDVAVAAGANQVGGVTFGVADLTALQDKALELAVADGIRRAGVMAKAAGVTLPALPESVEENSSYYDGGSARAYAMDAAAGASTSLMGGMVSVSSSVTVTYDVND